VKPIGQAPEVKATDDSQVLKRGEALYATHCASCHGPRGAGDGIAPRKPLPPPTDLTARRYSLAALADAIYHGVPGAAMPGYPQLSTDDLRAVAVFTQGLGAKAGHVKQSEAGEKIYSQNCATCHGREGKGDGDAAATAARRPANFHLLQPTAQQALKVVTEGAAGTTMPQWGAKLSEEQRKEVAEYVRGFYRE